MLLKQRLAMEFPQSIQDYIDGKDAFVTHHESLTLERLSGGSVAWRLGRGSAAERGSYRDRRSPCNLL